jgi:DNA-binding transcriptional LysR family regulator
MPSKAFQIIQYFLFDITKSDNIEPMLQFRQIQAFYTIMEIGTVTQAAKKLGISQPGVSNLISSLEHELGFVLFTRISGRLQPTAEAHRLMSSTATVISSFDQLNRKARAIRSQDVGKLDVAALPELSMVFLPDEIHHFIQDKKDIGISFQTRSSIKVQEMVSGHLAEIGVAEAPIGHDNLAGEIFSYECLCILPTDHPLASKTIITPEDLDGEPLVTLGSGHMTYHRLREIFAAKNCVWNNRCQTRLFHTALRFVQSGLGIGLVDPFTITSQPIGSVVVRKFEPSVSFDLAIVWATDKPVSIVGQSFISWLKIRLLEAKHQFSELQFPD